MKELGYVNILNDKKIQTILGMHANTKKVLSDAYSKNKVYGRTNDERSRFVKSILMANVLSPNIDSVDSSHYDKEKITMPFIQQAKVMDVKGIPEDSLRKL